MAPKTNGFRRCLTFYHSRWDRTAPIGVPTFAESKKRQSAPRVPRLRGLANPKISRMILRRFGICTCRKAAEWQGIRGTRYRSRNAIIPTMSSRYGMNPAARLPAAQVTAPSLHRPSLQRPSHSPRAFADGCEEAQQFCQVNWLDVVVVKAGFLLPLAVGFAGGIAGQGAEDHVLEVG